jgi:octaprenyl-diphosphate synthase
MPTTAIQPQVQRIDLESIQALVAAELAQVDDIIAQRLFSDVALVNQISHHIIHSGGKRLRPMLSLLSALACRYEGNAHLEFAAIVEFIHTATLLHDDVVDDSKLRRGKLTANAMFGNEASVLVGDFLYSRAFQMMVSAGSIRIMSIMADTTNTIAEGEVMQLLNCHDPETTEQRYLRVIEAKTATLFKAAGQIGAVLAEAPEAHIEALGDYGLHLGTAYQLVDDALDYQGNTGAIGKNVGDDIAEGKPTLPLIYALAHCNESQAQLLRKSIENGGLDQIDEIIDIVESTGAIQYTARCAEKHVEMAVKALSVLPESRYREALEQLAEFAVSRTY